MYVYFLIIPTILIPAPGNRRGIIPATYWKHGAAIAGSEEGYIKSITDEIHLAIGSEKDERKASELNVRRNVHLIQEAFADHPELQTMKTVGAVYDVETGRVDWLS